MVLAEMRKAVSSVDTSSSQKMRLTVVETLKDVGDVGRKERSKGKIPEEQLKRECLKQLAMFLEIKMYREQ